MPPALGSTVRLVLLSLVLGVAATSEGATDTRPPSRPGNLRATGVTHHSVGLAWSASSDNSGSFTYWIRCSNGYWEQVPQTATTATFTTALHGGVTYSFYVVAIDAAGNRSKNSNSVTVSLPRDTIAPAAPVVTIVDLGPTHASLSWSATDDGPHVVYSVFQNGVRVRQDTRETSGTFVPLQPETTYTFVVTARDAARNASPPSEPLAVTTEPVDHSDVTPPTTPAHLQAFPNGGGTELLVSWSESTDDVDPQDAIVYLVFINGVLSEHVVGTGTTVAYGEFGHNVLEVFAYDAAGNESAPATIEFEM
jgi:chitodextrinase